MIELLAIPSEGWTLHGLAHTPADPAGPRIGVVLFPGNGVNPKFGPHRLFRQLSDALVGAGFYVLRYDSRGTCDSDGIYGPDFSQRVADGRSVVGFFRSRYGLDTVLGWGLCMGAATAVHCSSARRPEEKLDGLILCNILAESALAWMPEFGFRQAEAWRLVWKMAITGSVVRKLFRAVCNFSHYRKKLPKLAATLLGRYRGREPELDQLQAAVGGVGPLLAAYPGRCLLIFGEKDAYRTSFLQRVNPGDRLGLAKKEFPPDWALVKDGDHTFASAGQTAELIRYTRDWLDSFRKGVVSGDDYSALREELGFRAAPVAD